MSRLSIRWRLTLFYCAMLAAVLGIFGAEVYLFTSRELKHRTEGLLATQMSIIEDLLARTDPKAARRKLVDRYTRHPTIDLQVAGPDGSILMRSDRIRERGLPAPSRPTPQAGGVYDVFRADDGGRFRVLSRTIAAGTVPLQIRIATSLGENDSQLADLMARIVLSVPLAVGCALCTGYWLAREALIPLTRMAASAEEITATRLDRRLESLNPDDELGRLARALNGMIARLEQSFQQVRRFTADAAHELRTPLAILRNEAEVALRVPRESEEYRTSLEDMLEEIEHLSQLSEALLFLFREDAGLGLRTRGIVRLDQFAAEMADDLRVVAAERGQTLLLEAASSCQVLADPVQLRRLLSNLLDNAINCTAAGGTITIEVDGDKDRARLVVADTGIGIAPEHLPRIFDRFYRGDSSRSRRTGGCGLGLSICKSIAEAHGGTIEVQSEPEKGTRVTLTLPSAGHADVEVPGPASLVV